MTKTPLALTRIVTHDDLYRPLTEPSNPKYVMAPFLALDAVKGAFTYFGKGAKASFAASDAAKGPFASPQTHARLESSRRCRQKPREW